MSIRHCNSSISYLEFIGKYSLIPDQSLLDETVREVIKADFASYPADLAHNLALAEYYAFLSKQTGIIASYFLLTGQWSDHTPEWFDHRLHHMEPDRFGNDYWTMPADLVLLKLPLHGKILDLCSGDGFYDYHFYAHRADEVIAVERHRQAFQQALRLHKRDNITYINEDIFHYSAKSAYFDVVVIRGAIEHFTEEDQLIIFKNAWNALRQGGWFCGDTPAKNNEEGYKMLNSHENEFGNAEELKALIYKVFPNVEVTTYESHDRTTLFWQAPK
ncbi:class I SAM-dependent methyltransferase [Trichlorobacter lovleyi]|uniref:class I SAM-dependent methyltransferase n=1 Tax=Trichlorobacter lovleyi TaxID=313985 RepID=UPI0024806133|nr:class I SAM-dependent methyltransferase [Trichlorobacter lovleyi]